MSMFASSMSKYDADIALITEPNVKWTPRNVDKMEYNLKRLER